MRVFEIEPSEAGRGAALEQQLCTLFAELIGAPTLTTDDDFFKSGGDSIAAIRLCTRLAEQLDIDIPPAVLFKHPTARRLAAQLRGMSSSDEPRDALTVPRARRTAEMPLTYAQERVWLMHALAPSSTAYTFSARVTFRGPLRIDVLRDALGAIVARHEVLRTTFHATDGRAVQRIHAAGVVDLQERSFEGLTPDEAHEQIEGERRAFVAEPLQLDRLPLVSWKLCRVSADEHVLLHREHHLLHDGWSWSLLYRELIEFYRAGIEQTPPQLAPAQLQIADVAVAQRAWVETGLFEAQLDHWRRQLAGAPAVLSLPTDRPRPAESSGRSETIRLELPAPLAHAVKEFAAREAITPFVAMLAPFVALLARLTGDSDFCIGTGIANRRVAHTEAIVGMIVNNVVLRVRPAASCSWRQLLAHVRDTVADALANQDIPFDAVVRAVGGPRTPGVQPLCQVFFSAYRDQTPNLTAAGVKATGELGLSTGSPKFDLNVIVIDADDTGRKTLIWEFDEDLWDGESMERYLRVYLELLRHCVAHPQESIDTLRLVTDDEQEWLLQQATGPVTAYPRDASIPELFQRQVADRAESVAVIDGQERWTYAELDRRAGAIAAALTGRGVRAGDVVGLLLERGAPAIASMLGILRVGAAYMPLRPKDPDARTAALCGLGGVKVAVTRGALASGLPDTVEALPVEHVSDEATHTVPHESFATATSLACVLFTSGSTGRPKGVEIPHRSIVRLVFGQDWVDLGPRQTVLQTAALSFDGCSFEIFGALLHGGRVVVHPEDMPSLPALEKTIAEHGVTLAWLVAPLFNVIADERPSVLRPLRQVIVGGEALSVPHVRRAAALFPDLAIVNGYGPTENGTFSCCYRLPRPIPESWRSIPLGRALANSRAYVLDPHRRLVPAGVAGEIYVAGDGLARGYCGRPDLTAELFVSDPFSDAGRERMYRTGDRGLVLPDGTIQFLGRADDQIKLNGFRIELGEIEAALLRLPPVRSCVAGVVTDAAGRKRLAAVVVPAEPGTTGTQIAARLAEQLPSYMVPRQVVVADALPVGPTGKLDRRQAMDLLATTGETAPIAPGAASRTTTETAVIEIFRDVLGREDLGLDEDFFLAGGHSLLVMQLLERLRERFGTSLNPARFMRRPTPRAVCEGLAPDETPSHLSARSWTALLPVRLEGKGRPVFFVPGGDGDESSVIFYGRLSEFVPERPFFGLRSTRSDGIDRVLGSSVEQLAALFIGEMRQVQPRGPYDLAGGCIGGIIAFEMARQLNADGEEVRRLVLVDAAYPTPVQRLRQFVRGRCSRVRRMLRGSTGQPGALYDVVSRLLPFAERDAPAELKDCWIAFADLTQRYRPQPYAGAVHLVFSQQLSDSGVAPRWTRCVRGNLSIAVVPGDHWTYIREHLDSVGAAFRKALE